MHKFFTHLTFLSLTIACLAMFNAKNIQAQNLNASIKTETKVPTEKAAGANDEAFSDWEYTQRVNDPLKSTATSKLIFREKRIAVGTSLSPDALRISTTGTANGTNNLSLAEQNRSQVKAITRYREIPLEQNLPGNTAFIDLTNENPSLQPSTPSGKKIRVKLIEQSGSKRLNSANEWVDNSATFATNDFVAAIPTDLPWTVTGKNKTMMDWAINQANGVAPQSKVNGVILVDARNNSVKGGGKLYGKIPANIAPYLADFSKAHILINVGNCAAIHAGYKSLNMQGLVIACVSTGKSVMLINGITLAGPTQIVCNANTIIGSSLGYDSEMNLTQMGGFPSWAETDYRKARWRLMAPDFQVAPSDYVGSIINP